VVRPTVLAEVVRSPLVTASGLSQWKGANNLSDIEKYVDGSMQSPERLSWSASQLDRRKQNQHVVRMQDLRRSTELAVAEEGAKLVQQLARFERYGRANTEAKFKLERAKKESLILQGEDPELRAKFALLDDDLLQRLRLDLIDEQ
jgi:hypothetical protein